MTITHQQVQEMLDEAYPEACTYRIRVAPAPSLALSGQTTTRPAVIKAKHAGGRKQGVHARALELAFQGGAARYMTEGNLEDWAERISKTGTLFTDPKTKNQHEYADAIGCNDWRDTIRKRFQRALQAVGKKLLPGDSFRQN